MLSSLLKYAQILARLWCNLVSASFVETVCFFLIYFIYFLHHWGQYVRLLLTLGQEHLLY